MRDATTDPGQILCQLWRTTGPGGRHGMVAVFHGPRAHADAVHVRDTLFPTGRVAPGRRAVWGDGAWTIEADVTIGDHLHGETVAIARRRPVGRGLALEMRANYRHMRQQARVREIADAMAGAVKAGEPG